MQIAEFVEETSQIEQFFEKELTDFQRENWYQELKYIDIERYRQIVKQVFRKCKFMPKLADIITIQEELLYQQSKKEKQKVAKKEIIFEKVMKKPSAVKNLIDEFKEYSIENYDFDIDKVGDAKIYRFFSREFDQKQVLDRVTNEETVENIVMDPGRKEKRESIIKESSITD